MAAARNDTDVLIAGAGPIGLTAAVELRRHSVRCRVVDPLAEAPQYAKAVGVQPRTLEVFEGMGLLRDVLDAATLMRGQIAYVDGEETARIELALPPDIPFGFIGLPQYETERILATRLAELDTRVERGIGLVGFEQDDACVSAHLSGSGADETVTAQFLIGADGAHSIVRKTLGLSFEGAAFAEQYMLGDVEVDWSLPPGYVIRAQRHRADLPDDLLVCIPLPGRGRYRMSMLVPPELAIADPAPGAGDGVVHGLEGGRKPELHHIQAVLDRLAPEPAQASNLRWSSVFRISHRIVDAYGRGRVFIAGDAAHIHPPTGAQGMNTGIQDAHNLAWKLALAVTGVAADGLLDSYDAERRPVGEEVVGRTVRDARTGVGTGAPDLGLILRREAQLLIDYADSPIVAGPTGEQQPAPGARAPDARGLLRDAVAFPMRLFSLLDRRRHTAIVYADADADALADTTAWLDDLVATTTSAAHGQIDVVVVTPPAAASVVHPLPRVVDGDGDFARQYAATDRTVFVIRPDGYLAFRQSPGVAADLAAHLKSTFR